MTFVLGLDGCRAGWCGVMIEVRDGGVRPLGAEIFPTFASALGTGARVIAIDIPIGLLDVPGQRTCDHEARRLLGRPGSSSVFPPPSRRASAVREYWEASAVNLDVAGSRLTRQSFNITPKIREVDEEMSPALQTRIYEVHPELCFWSLNSGERLNHKKKRKAGRAERWALLHAALQHLPGAPPAPRDMPDGCAVDDYLDALAAAWTALCVFEARAQRVPLGAQKDARGLRMEVWYPEIPDAGG
jgi:predicted RNase H-like nuclease